MRRLFAIFLALAACVSGAPMLTSAASASGQVVPPDDAGKGLVYAGLRRAATDGPCRGAFELLDRLPAGSGWREPCTHGPDPAPEGVDVRESRPPETAPAAPSPTGVTAAVTATVGCYGTGNDGFRVQLMYANSSSSPDRFPDYAASFATWAARIDQVVNDSAAETGGARHVRFVTDAACNPVIDRVTLSPSAMGDVNTMISELRGRGYSRTDRKYLVWADATVYCGIGEVYNDDRGDRTPGVNFSNGHPSVPGEFGRVDSGCWGRTNLAEAHELMHTLGGVQPSAPNATPGYHCTDESDRLCYADGSVSSSQIRQVCPTQHESLYDCNHDDYFSTAPPAGSYLSTHWNTANSAFLTGGRSTSPPPPPAEGAGGGGGGGPGAEKPPPINVDGGTWNGTGFYNSGSVNSQGGDVFFTLTFSKPGTYKYVCLIHPDMEGTVKVA